MAKEPDGVIALRAAADMLVAAMQLRKFSDPAIREAFKLLHSSNPSLVDWTFGDLAKIARGED